MGISRQAHYEALKRQKKTAEKEILYVGFIVEVRKIHPGMGLRRIYDQYKPEGIGRDAFIALGLKHGYRLRAIPTPHITTRSVRSAAYGNLLQDKRFTDVNQVWVSDITYYILNGKHYYLTLIMDAYSRYIVGYSIADNMRAENNVAALNMAIKARGIKKFGFGLIHHSDRGSQYISNEYMDLLHQHEIKVSMCRDVLENAHSERVNGTIKNEYLRRRNIGDFRDLQWWTKNDIANYNNRLHQAIKDTPANFEKELPLVCLKERYVLQFFIKNRLLQNDQQLQLNFDS